MSIKECVVASDKGGGSEERLILCGESISSEVKK